MTSDGSTTVVPSETILLVDDEVLVRMVIASYLRECGYRVIEAMNTAEALMVLQTDDVVIDAVLNSVEMPGPMNGFELAVWLRKNRPGIPIVLAGTAEKAAKKAQEICKEATMLSRPYESEIVLREIRRMLGGWQKQDKAPLG